MGVDGSEDSISSDRSYMYATFPAMMDGLDATGKPTTPDAEPEHAADAQLLKPLNAHLKQVMHESRTWTFDDPRANIIEPELGYALRHLEMTMQQGMGNGHGLIAIMRVNK